MKTTPTLPRSLMVCCLGLGLALGAARTARADMELPRPSPFAKVSQDVGLTTVTVDYSSPGVKGRKIWGGLVPYDKMWRTGANTATKITFSRDAMVAGKPVPAGTYALFTIPASKGDWTLILNKRVDQPGTGQGYKQEEDLLRAPIHTKAAPFRERMTFVFNDSTDDKASLDLEWEKLRVSIPIATDTGKQALASVHGTLDNTWRTYANGARYLVESQKDTDLALKYIDQSLALKEDWYNLWIKAEVLAAKGNYKEAYPMAEKAYAMGQKAEVFFLEPEVKKALTDWKKKV